MMRAVPTAIPEVVIFEPAIKGDARGYFMETYRQNVFGEHGAGGPFVQENQSGSGRGVLRGLHYQIEQPQGKLVRVIAGVVFDVAVDLRRSSPTFGRWVGAEVSDQNRRSLWVPPGFGHGFLVLSEHAEFIYKCTDYYAPQHERVIRYDDPDLAVAWPIPAGVAVVVSDKDRAGVSFRSAEVFA